VRCWIVADDRVGVALAVFWSVLAVVIGLVAWAETSRERRVRR